MAERPKVADAIAAARHGGGRSDIYEWLWADFDALAPALNRVGVNWQALADLAIKHGLKGGRGTPPSAEMVRQTWKRVRAERKGGGKAEAKATRISVEATRTAATPAPTAAPPKRQASATAPTDDDPFAGMTFAGPKKWT